MDELALESLFKAYFHQDFYEVYGGVWETVDAFVRDDPIDARRILDEVPHVLDRHPSDEDVRRYLTSVGCSYRSELHDGGSREWLREISRHVQARLTEQN